MVPAFLLFLSATILIHLVLRSLSLCPLVNETFLPRRRSLSQPPNEEENEDQRSSCLFVTSLPIYYINLDRSTDRRKYMETVFGQCAPLHRVRAIDGNNENIEALVGFDRLNPQGDNMTFESYLQEIRTTKNELALVMSHFRALQQALEDNVDVAIIVEDDVSPILSPYWPLSLDQLAQNIQNTTDGDWDLVRLQHIIAEQSTKATIRGLSRDNPYDVFVRRRIYAWGMVAYMVSRRGILTLRERFLDKDGKFDCLQRNRVHRCLADYLIPGEVPSVSLVVPPYFTTRIMEDATGVRKSGRVMAVSDEWRAHYTAVIDSIQWNIENFELRQALATAGDEDPSASLQTLMSNFMCVEWQLFMRNDLPYCGV